MKFSNTAIAAASLFGLACHAETVLSCYDDGWDIDISEDSLMGTITEFCNLGGEDESPGSVGYDAKRDDGSDFEIELNAGQVPDPDECRGGLLKIVIDCLAEESDGGDPKKFQGGAMYNSTEDAEEFSWTLSINCGTGSCP